MKILSILTVLVMFIYSFAFEMPLGNPFKEKVLYIGIDVSRDSVECKEAFRSYIAEVLKTVSWRSLRKGNIREVNIFLFDNQVRIVETISFKGSSMSRSSWKRFAEAVKESLRQMLRKFYQKKKNFQLRDMTAAFDYVEQMVVRGKDRKSIVVLFTGAFQQYDREVIKKLKYEMPEKTYVLSAFGKCLYETYSQRRLVFDRFVKEYWKNIKNVKWILLP